MPETMVHAQMYVEKLSPRMRALDIEGLQEKMDMTVINQRCVADDRDPCGCKREREQGMGEEEIRLASIAPMPPPAHKETKKERQARVRQQREKREEAERQRRIGALTAECREVIEKLRKSGQLAAQAQIPPPQVQRPDRRLTPSEIALLDKYKREDGYQQALLTIEAACSSDKRTETDKREFLRILQLSESPYKIGRETQQLFKKWTPDKLGDLDVAFETVIKVSLYHIEVVKESIIQLQMALVLNMKDSSPAEANVISRIFSENLNSLRTAPLRELLEYEAGLVALKDGRSLAIPRLEGVNMVVERLRQREVREARERDRSIAILTRFAKMKKSVSEIGDWTEKVEVRIRDREMCAFYEKHYGRMQDYLEKAMDDLKQILLRKPCEILIREEANNMLEPISFGREPTISLEVPMFFKSKSVVPIYKEMMFTLIAAANVANAYIDKYKEWQERQVRRALQTQARQNKPLAKIL